MTIAVLAGYKSELTTATVAPSPRTAGATDSRDGGTPFWMPVSAQPALLSDATGCLYAEDADITGTPAPAYLCLRE
jgi:hypothetical protein